MNYITEELKEEKDSVLEYYLGRDYKVIYPNKNIKIQLKRRYDGSTSRHIRTGLWCWKLNLWDRIFTYKNDLFLKPCNFGKNYSKTELIISRDNFSGSFNLGTDVYIASEGNVGSETLFLEKIKYILFYQGARKVVIITDNNFKTKAAKKHEEKIKNKKQIEEELDLTFN